MSERPWTEWNGGTPPFPVGTLVDVRWLSGIELHGIPYGCPHTFPAGLLTNDRVEKALVRAFWCGPRVYICESGKRAHGIVAYRLHIDPQAEADRVNARQALFHGWRREAETLPTCVPPEPVEPREKVR